MAKFIRRVSTRGIDSLNLSTTVLGNLFLKAIELKDKSPFISFQPIGSRLKITDGNEKYLGEMPLYLPQKVWIIFDEHVDQIIATALLPSEY